MALLTSPGVSLKFQAPQLHNREQMMSEIKQRKGSKRRKSSTRKKKRSKKTKSSRKEGGFSVWRAVSLLPSFSWSIVLSGLFLLSSLSYVGFVVNQAQKQLNINLATNGVRRTYQAHQDILLSLEANKSPQKVTIIDARLAPLWVELAQRFGKDIGTAPPFVTNKDPDVNRGQWHTALRSRGVDFIESVGVGAAGEVSLIWPPAPAPLPTLIVGHYYDQIAWVDPQRGVILSSIPSSWQNSPSMRLPPRLSRRW